MTPSHEHIRGWIAGLPGPVAVTYEAGPTGFGLARALTADGIRCVVAAPSKLQRPSGDRVKTEARDAVHLARLLRLDEVTAVVIPSAEQEAARDLVRAREDCRGDLMRARHRLSQLLLRRGIVYSGGRAWTAITTMAASSEFTPVVRRLNCLRGVSRLTSFPLAEEIGDWQRFTGNTIGAFVGLVPSEYSSGPSQVQGSITKTGNTHARRLLIEAAWHHRARYRAGATMLARWDLASPAARARGDEGNRRLHARWARFGDRHKRAVIANVAIARELAGWCWSLATLEDDTMP